MKIFEKVNIGKLELKNRIIRSATFEGMADGKGFPRQEYIDFYKKLAENGVGAIITGFAYISQDGKAMQPGQVGVDSEEKIPVFRKLTETVHNSDCLIFKQIAHTGRQTLESVTGKKVIGVSAKKSIYFNQKPEVLSTEHAYRIIEDFGNAALICKKSGFDGVQIHAAHGYLIHQFLTPAINNRADEFAIDKNTGIGTFFLEKIIENVRQKCGNYFPILVKISGSDDLNPKFNQQKFIELVKFLDKQKVNAIEISYGTMDYALNIFRGDVPVNLILKKNPIYKSDNSIKKFVIKSLVFPVLKMKLKPFSPTYNLDYALIARKFTKIPVISVGGFRTGLEIGEAIKKGIDFVGLSRPLICESDFVRKLEADIVYKSKCTNCNYCAIMCDTENRTKCYNLKN